MSIQREFDWTMLNQYYSNLRTKWFRLIPSNKLLKIIYYVQKKPDSIENFKSVLSAQSHETVRILAKSLDRKGHYFMRLFNFLFITMTRFFKVVEFFSLTSGYPTEEFDPAK